jgi:hypothetical protein
MAVQEDVCGREVKVIDGMLLVLESGAMLAVHEDTNEVVGGREGGIGVIGMDLASDSGTMFMHEDIDKDNGSRGGEVGVFKINEMGDL